ncbi:MAG: acyl-CoA dehydrogenase family protein [Burkholderiaceae bacterium]|nr:acyl-CoA dehydrogenase family protein [Burkholderiaceae bacterium]
MENSQVSDSAERVFSGNVDRALLLQFESGKWPEQLWALAERSGFPEVLVSQERGGFGGDWGDAQAVLRSAAAHSAPIPLAETIVARQLLDIAGLQAPAGPITLIEQDCGAVLQLRRSGKNLLIDGSASAVPWARWCPWALVSAQIDGAPHLALLDLRDTACTTLTPHENIAREPRDELRFQGTPSVAHAALHGLAARPVWALGALTRCIGMVGAMEATLSLCLRYAREREQFGRPIGQYQSLQHLLAVMVEDVSSARVATQVACKAALSATSGFDIAVAKVRSSEAAGRCAAIAHQVHGAMGTTHEYALNFLTRRLWSWRREFGTDAHWAQALGAAAIAAGAEGFWSGMTQRNLLPADGLTP